MFKTRRSTPIGLVRLLFLATHLDHRPDDRERFASTTAINKRVVENKWQPA